MDKLSLNFCASVQSQPQVTQASLPLTSRIGAFVAPLVPRISATSHQLKQNPTASNDSKFDEIKEIQKSIFADKPSRLIRLESMSSYSKLRESVEPQLTKLGFSLNQQSQLNYKSDFKVPNLKTASLSIVRHGQTDGNKKVQRQGVCDQEVNQLNSTGKTQANSIEIEDNFYDVILVSPLGRAQDTTSPLLKKMLEQGVAVTVIMEDAVKADRYSDRLSPQLLTVPNVMSEKVANGVKFTPVAAFGIVDKQVEVHISNDVREMSFGFKENEHVFGTDSKDISHCMEYDQNVVAKVKEPYIEIIPGAQGATRSIEPENFAELLIRANDTLSNISVKFAEKHVLISSHGIYTRAMLVLMGSDAIKKDSFDGHLQIDGPTAGSVPNGKLYQLQSSLT